MCNWIWDEKLKEWCSVYQLSLTPTEAQITFVVYVNVCISFLPVTTVLQLSEWLIVGSGWILGARRRNTGPVIGG